jgi:hypothetical protein
MTLVRVENSPRHYAVWLPDKQEYVVDENTTTTSPMRARWFLDIRKAIDCAKRQNCYSEVIMTCTVREYRKVIIDKEATK